MRTRNSMLLAAAAFTLAAALPGLSAQAETVVRYGISMADIPLTTG
jgi:peptide/nickel transport system substrate-binding protein